MKTIDLLTNKILRDEVINEERLEVLDKVKKLTMLENTNLVTLKEVANYYEVGTEAIKSLTKRNKEELENNGMKYYKKSEIVLMVQSEPIENNNYNIEPIENIPNRGTNMFTKRSILNIGMLLEESKVAEQVRTMLLDNHEQLNNIHEKLENGEKINQEDINKTSTTYYIDKETELRNKEKELSEQYVQAFMSGNVQLKDNLQCQINMIKEHLISLEKERNGILVHTKKTYTTSELATELGFKSANALNKDLSEKKIQYKVNGTWKLYSKYDGQGYTETKQTELNNGTIIYNTRWTGEGRQFLLENIYNNNKEVV